MLVIATANQLRDYVEQKTRDLWQCFRDREASFRDREASFRDRETSLRDKEASLHDNEAQLLQANQTIESLFQSLSDKEAQLLEANQTIESLSQSLSEKEAHLLELTQMIEMLKSKSQSLRDCFHSIVSTLAAAEPVTSLFNLAAKAGRKLDSIELVEVSKQVAETWQRVALNLLPEFFSPEKIAEIETQYTDLSTQAHAAFDLWSKNEISKATCHHMINALCKAGCRTQAVEVFSFELVQFARPQ